MQKQPFAPAYGNGQTMSVTTSSQNLPILKDPKVVCFTNTGTGLCYVRMTPDNSAATIADFPIPAGAQKTLTKSETCTSVSVIGAATTTLHIMPGEGFITS